MNLPKTEQELKDLCVEFAIFSYAAPTMQSRYTDYDAFIAERNKPNKPNLYEGLTKEQLDIVIKEELLCELTSHIFEDVMSSVYKIVYDNDSDARFYISEDDWRDNKYYTSCLIHHSQTQFNTGKKPDWLDDEQSIKCRLESGSLVMIEAGGMAWGLDIGNPIIRWQVQKV